MNRNPLLVMALTLLLGLVACNQPMGSILPKDPTSPSQTIPPENPANLQAKALSDTQAEIKWDTVSNALHYTLEGKNPDGTYSKIFDLEATTASVNNLAAKTTYTFRVKASNDAGSSSGAEVSVTTLNTPVDPALPTPGEPRSFVVSAGSATSASLSWEAPGSGVVNSYSLERGLGSSPTAWTPLALAASSHSYTDTELAPNLSYTYRLRSNNSSGSSGWIRQNVSMGAAASPKFKIEELDTKIGVAWSIRFDPTHPKRFYFTPRDEKTLQIQRYDLDSKAITRFVAAPQSNIRNGGGTESGILGMDLDPDFSNNHRAYVCYGYYDASSNPRTRVSRVELDESTQSLINETYLVNDIPGNFYHNGCRVLWGIDNKLYITTGDAQYGDKAQDLNSTAGKSLRINPDGSIPSDNPFPGNPVLTIGHRNPQGIAFHPVTGQLWSTEHGPNTRDEINILKPGKNYGWPICLGTQIYGSTISSVDGAYVCGGGNIAQDSYAPATREYEANGTIAPSDLIFYPLTGSAFPAWRGSLFFNTLKTGRLYRLETSGETITKQEILIDNTQGRLREIVAGPDGFIYISTDAGRLIRLVPE